MKPNSSTKMTRAEAKASAHEADIRAQVRLQWCLYGGGAEADAKAAKEFGISVACVKLWRKNCEPDGQNWEQFRIELALANDRAQVAMLATHNEVRVHAEIIGAAQRILGAVSASLTEGVLYDRPPPKKDEHDMRQEVKCLWTVDGREVPVGPVRPKSASDAVRMLAGLSTTLDNSYKRVEQLQEMMHNAAERESEVLMLCGDIVRSLWGDEGYQRFLSAVASAGEEGEKSVAVEFEAEDVAEGEFEAEDEEQEEE